MVRAIYRGNGDSVFILWAGGHRQTEWKFSGPFHTKSKSKKTGLWGLRPPYPHLRLCRHPRGAPPWRPQFLFFMKCPTRACPSRESHIESTQKRYRTRSPTIARTLKVLAAPIRSEKDTGEDGCVQFFSTDFHRLGVNSRSYTFLKSTKKDNIHFLSSRTSSAFWAWSRFSASSQTRLWPPSITSSVISSPRWAGRQWSTRASGDASFIKSESTV